MTYYCNPWWLGDPAFYETQIFSSEKIRQIWDPCRIFGSASSGIPRAKTSRSQGKTSNGFLKSRAILKSPWTSILSPDLMNLMTWSILGTLKKNMMWQYLIVNTSKGHYLTIIFGSLALTGDLDPRPYQVTRQITKIPSFPDLKRSQHLLQLSPYHPLWLESNHQSDPINMVKKWVNVHLQLFLVKTVESYIS